MTNEDIPEEFKSMVMNMIPMGTDGTPDFS
jgi:hypothetical protein